MDRDSWSEGRGQFVFKDIASSLVQCVVATQEGRQEDGGGELRSRFSAVAS